MKLKNITIMDWFDSQNLNFRWDLEPDVNILIAPTGTGKSTLAEDLLDLILPTSYSTMGVVKTPTWRSRLTKTQAKVDFELREGKTNRYVSWVGGGTYPDSYSLVNYNPQKVETILGWYPECMIDIINSDELCEDQILGWYANQDEKNQVKILNAINKVTKDWEGMNELTGILEVVHTDKSPSIMFEFAGGKRKSLESMSFGWRMLISLMVNIPMGPDTVYIVDNPEFGICEEWCKRLPSAMVEANPGCQFIILTGQSNIAYEYPLKKKNLRDLLNYGVGV